MTKVFKMYDVAGIHNLHGMPGILGAIAGAILASQAEPDVYGYEGWGLANINRQKGRGLTMLSCVAEMNYGVDLSNSLVELLLMLPVFHDLDWEGKTTLYFVRISNIFCSHVELATYLNSFKSSLYNVFAARAPVANSTQFYMLKKLNVDFTPGDGRTAKRQALFQLAGLACSIGLGVFGGILSGE